MQNRAYDLAAVPPVVDISAVRTSLKDLLNERLVTDQATERSQQTRQAEHLRSG